MGTLVEKINYLKETKTAIKNAIVAKGVSVSDTDTFRSYAGKIGSIKVGSPSQEKSINITNNGSVAVTPDSGYLLSKVNVNVNVASSGGGSENNARISFIKYTNGASLYNLIISIDLSSFDTSNVTDMGSMFYGLSGLSSLDLSLFNTSKVTNMNSMFSGCSNLRSLDVSLFNTSKVTSMNSMFSSCTSIQSLDLSSFNTSNVTNMYGMFSNCPDLLSLDLSSFDTGNLTSMGSMFSGCLKLVSLDLSSFDTGKVTGMSSMLYNCSKLKTLTLGNNWASNTSMKTFDLSYCSALSHDSLVDIMNKLATRTNSPKIKLSTASKNLLTDSEKAIATNKGWTIA